MAKITRIKASDGPRETGAPDDDAVVKAHLSVKEEKTAANDHQSAKTEQTKKTEKKAARQAKKQARQAKKAGKKPFVLFRPFIALGHYLRDSWQELRQVRWPNRKTTWQMLVAVIIYAAVFMVFITLLDLFFSWLFNLMLSK